MSNAEHIKVLKRERVKVAQRREEAAEAIRGVKKASGNVGTHERQATLDAQHRRALATLRDEERRLSRINVLIHNLSQKRRA